MGELVTSPRQHHAPARRPLNRLDVCDIDTGRNLAPLVVEAVPFEAERPRRDRRVQEPTHEATRSVEDLDTGQTLDARREGDRTGTGRGIRGDRREGSRAVGGPSSLAVRRCGIHTTRLVSIF